MYNKRIDDGMTLLHQYVRAILHSYAQQNWQLDLSYIMRFVNPTIDLPIMIFFIIIVIDIYLIS